MSVYLATAVPLSFSRVCIGQAFQFVYRFTVLLWYNLGRSTCASFALLNHISTYPGPTVHKIDGNLEQIYTRLLQSFFLLFDANISQEMYTTTIFIHGLACSGVLGEVPIVLCIAAARVTSTSNLDYLLFRDLDNLHCFYTFQHRYGRTPHQALRKEDLGGILWLCHFACLLEYHLHRSTEEDRHDTRRISPCFLPSVVSAQRAKVRRGVSEFIRSIAKF